MKSYEKFLIDSNSLITPFNLYYPFDIMPNFWSQVKNHVEAGNIILLDMVKDELLKGNDELSQWIKEFDRKLILSHGITPILNIYSQVLNYVQTCNYYKEKALADWAKRSSADPWLIAAAATYQFTIITFEHSNQGLNTKSKSGRALIPDVAKVFNVECKDLFYMMRELSFRF